MPARPLDGGTFSFLGDVTVGPVDGDGGVSSPLGPFPAAATQWFSNSRRWKAVGGSWRDDIYSDISRISVFSSAGQRSAAAATAVGLMDLP